ncbi:MAG TPA: HAD family hydrolase [Candidatus Angelobacter sp.]|nr:HAD family hydrolase [Candidatus Angelobacter sp.]
MPDSSRKTKNKRTTYWPIIRCVIFDLDDTLYDCLRQRLPAAHRHAAKAMVKAGLNARVEAVYRARMRAFQRNPMLRYIDPEVARRFQAVNPEAVTTAAREAYFTCPVGKLKLFRGSLPLLRFLARCGVKNFIVSFGEPAIQRQKVRALGLDREPSVEKIYYADRDNVLTKEAAFQKIQKQLGLRPEQVLVVGDRPAREIRAGNDLGMYTVRIHRGEFQAQLPIGPQEEPDYVVRSLAEIRKLPFLFG